MNIETDLLIRNARVFTVDDSQPWAEAVGAAGDRISFVGPDLEAASFAGPRTKVIDAHGRLVLPGLIDAHTHCLSAYQTYFWADLSGIGSVDALLSAVQEHARGHPEHPVVGGSGFRYSAIMSGDRLPDRSVIDRVVGDRPAWLVSYDGWTACTNTRLLEVVQDRLGSSFDRLPGVERDPHSGQPTGVFYKAEDLEPLVEELATEGTDVVYDGLRLVMRDLARSGLTGIHEVGARSMRDLQLYDRLRTNGELKTRTYVAIQYSRDRGQAQISDMNRARSEYSDEWLRAGAVKFFIDGVGDSHTAAMLEPYQDLPGVSGETIYAPEEFDQIVEKLDAIGFQCITHACGDRGVRTALDAYERAALRNGPRDRRHRVEHVEQVSTDDVPRFRNLGVVPDMQPLHAGPSAADVDEVYARAIGQERLARSFPWRSIVASGARFAFSSDWPVADMNPFLGIHCALTRRGSAGHLNTVSLEDAIRGYTINAAYASFEDDIKGSIEVGKLADMVVLSDDLFEIPEDDIKDVRPVLTFIGGKEVYRSGDCEG